MSSSSIKEPKTVKADIRKQRDTQPNKSPSSRNPIIRETRTFSYPRGDPKGPRLRKLLGGADSPILQPVTPHPKRERQGIKPKLHNAWSEDVDWEESKAAPVERAAKRSKESVVQVESSPQVDDVQADQHDIGQATWFDVLMAYGIVCLIIIVMNGMGKLMWWILAVKGLVGEDPLDLEE